MTTLEIKSRVVEIDSTYYFINKREYKKNLKRIIDERKEECNIIEYPYGVFFAKNISDIKGRGIQIIKKSCHGFFKTEELARMAITLLNSNLFWDDIFIQKMTNETKHLIEDYQTVNGFVNPLWYINLKLIIHEDMDGTLHLK